MSHPPPKSVDHSSFVASSEVSNAPSDAWDLHLVLLGTVGENNSLRPEEKRTALRAAVEEEGRPALQRATQATG